MDPQWGLKLKRSRIKLNCFSFKNCGSYIYIYRVYRVLQYIRYSESSGHSLGRHPHFRTVMEIWRWNFILYLHVCSFYYPVFFLKYIFFKNYSCIYYFPNLTILKFDYIFLNVIIFFLIYIYVILLKETRKRKGVGKNIIF